MRVGLVTACYKPVINGVTRMVALYKEYLEKNDHQVTVFTLGPSGDAELGEGVVRSPALSLGRTGYHLALRYSRAAQNEMRRMDILHCHHPLMGLEMADRYGLCPIVFTNHTRYDIYLSAYSPLSEVASEQLVKRVWPSISAYCDAVIAPSMSLKKLLEKLGLRTPVEVIVNGIDLGLFQAGAQKRQAFKNRAEQAMHIIYVGRLADEKNVDSLIREFALASEANPDLHLTLVGDGHRRRALERLAFELGVAGSTHFTGEVDPSQVPALLLSADVFATRSLSEVHPLTVIEAMATGLPVVATRSPGMIDIVQHGQTGLLGQDKKGEMADQLITLSQDPERRQRMASAAFRASAQYDIEKTVFKTIELYERLVTQRPDISRRDKRWSNRARKRIFAWQELLPQPIRSAIKPSRHNDP